MNEQSSINRRTFIGGLGLVGLAAGTAAARRLLLGSDTPTAHAQDDGHGDQPLIGRESGRTELIPDTDLCPQLAAVRVTSRHERKP